MPLYLYNVMTTITELNNMAQKYDYMYLLAANQKGYLSDNDFDFIVQIQEAN